MSNVDNFYSKGFPIGSSATYGNNFNGTINPTDGSQWVVPALNNFIPYSSEYSNIANQCIIYHDIVNGPLAGGNFLFTLSSQPYAPLCYSSSLNRYVTRSVETTYGSTPAKYYTSDDNGATWTKRSFPNLITYSGVYFVGGYFFAFASLTTNCFLLSTDGIAWSSFNNPVSAAPANIIANGSTIIISYNGSTSGLLSTNGGTSFSTITFPTSATGPTPTVGYGTYNTNAGLYIHASGTGGIYMTSPDGTTWTNRTPNSFSSYPQFSNGASATKFASNGTITVAIGIDGFFATSTDNLTWSNHGYIFNEINGPAVNFLCYDGTRFVASYTSKWFYSTNGTTWVEGNLITPAVTQLASFCQDVILVTSFTGLLATVFKINDITSSTKKYVTSGALVSAVSNNAYRIK